MSQPTYSSGLLFSQAHKAVRSAIYEVLEQYELSASHWAILGATVQAQDGIRLTNVAKQMDVKAPLITLLAGELIEKGLINRVQHHTDKRAKLLVATLKGKRLALQVETELAMKIATLLHGTTTQEVQNFQKVLEIILLNASRSEA